MTEAERSINPKGTEPIRIDLLITAFQTGIYDEGSLIIFLASRNFPRDVIGRSVVNRCTVEEYLMTCFNVMLLNGIYTPLMITQMILD